MAKELKPRSGGIDRTSKVESLNVPRQVDNSGRIAELNYNPELDSNVDSTSNQSSDSGGPKWHEDGSGWMADKLENAATGGIKNVMSGGSDESKSQNESPDLDNKETDIEIDNTNDTEVAETENASVEGQNSVGEPEGIAVDESEEESGPTIMERVTGFAKNAVTQNSVSKGVKNAISAGMGLLTGAGLGTGASAVVLVSVSILTVATVGVTGAAIVASNNVRLDTQVVKINDCDDEESAAKKAADAAAAGDTFNDAQQLENVKKIYSVLKEYGLTDIQIAGAIGNMEQESGINPKRIEAMDNPTDSDYQKANEKGSTIENLFGSWGEFVSLYNGGLDESGYLVGDKHWMGVGLIQWTGGSNHSLWKWAIANKLDMWNLDTQLTALLTPDSGPYANRLKTFVEKDNSTPEKAALNFLNYVEYQDGNFTPNDGTHAKAEKRQKYAAAWYVKIKEMQVDKNYAKSILDKVSSSIKAASDDKVKSTKYEADNCNDKSTSFGGTGWQKKEGVYSANNGGFQAWKYDELPDELKKYAIDPRSLGMKFGSSEGWTIGASHYIGQGIYNQCTTLSAALIGVLWEKDGKPIGVNHGMSSAGSGMVNDMVSALGVKKRIEPVSGDVFSYGSSTGSSDNHTGVVSHVFENGDILVIEQNVKGISGASRTTDALAGNINNYEWGYQYIPKAKYESVKYTFTSPESAGYKISSKAKSVG